MKNRMQYQLYRLYSALITVIPPIVACSLLFTSSDSSNKDSDSLSLRAAAAVILMLLGLIANFIKSTNPKVQAAKKYAVPVVYILVVAVGVGIRFFANSMIQKLILIDDGGMINYQHIADAIGLSRILSFGESVALVGGSLILGTVLSYLFHPVAKLYYILSYKEIDGVSQSINQDYLKQSRAWKKAFRGHDVEYSTLDKIRNGEA